MLKNRTFSMVSKVCLSKEVSLCQKDKTKIDLKISFFCALWSTKNSFCPQKFFLTKNLFRQLKSFAKNQVFRGFSL
ncbi:hypothetical protein HanIR_Chr16g0836931 [Helianthus annuus]|nr:hypothetical protein HanIR_Chr16g0836931 [Helianthus annuus]